MMAHFRMPPPPSIVERVRPTTMGDLQHFCLRWNNYQNSITTAFENLRDDEDFIDVTLACDGKTLKAHRVVLSACSPYFRELLKSTPCKHPVIVLQDVVFDDLHALVEFIYHGEVNVHQRNLTSFLKTAEVLKVSGLTQQNAATATTPASSASPSSDHYNENSSTRFSTRSPCAPSDKTNPFQQPFLYSANYSQINVANDDRNSPRTSLLAGPHINRHRRHIRSPTPIRSSHSQDDSPISLKRAKSVDTTLQTQSLNCSTTSLLLSPSAVVPNEEPTASSRTCKSSYDGLSSSSSSSSSSSRRDSPNGVNNGSNNSSSSTSTSSNSGNNNGTTNSGGNAINSAACIVNNNSNSNNKNNNNNNNTDTSTNVNATNATTTLTTTNTSTNSGSSSNSNNNGGGNNNVNQQHLQPVNYNENHNDEETVAANMRRGSVADDDDDDDEDDEPPVDFSTSSVKKYSQKSSFSCSKSSSSPKNFSLKSEPMDLASGSSNNNNNSGISNNNSNDNNNNNNNNHHNNEDDNDNDDDVDDDTNNNNNNNNFNDEDSNQSEDRLSDQSSPPNVPYPQTLLEQEDAFQGHRNYLDSKLFAAAGASFSFNMAAAALAADSLAGFNHHQNHTGVAANAVLDGLTASSQGLKKVFPCLACGKVLCSKASLKRHVADKHASHQEEYRCAICERVYCSRNSLMTHIYTYHKTRPTLLIPPPHHTPTPTSHATDIKF